MTELSVTLANYKGAGYVIAPAGYGKTHLIATATARSTGRQLILTHTHAGVNSLQHKMRMLGVSNRLYHIDTIASWILRLALSYSKTTGWDKERPTNNTSWNALYKSGSALLDEEFIHRVIRASYDGLYVDEYQDCSVTQHEIILKLARILPCRVLGDPLQGIFNFAGQPSVDWSRDVEGSFTHLSTLGVPYRWKLTGAEELGMWLQNARNRLLKGESIDLNKDRPASVTVVLSRAQLSQEQCNICRTFQCEPNDTVIAVHSGTQRATCNELARNIGGRFSSIEEVEGKALFSFINGIEHARTSSARLKKAIKFASECLTAVKLNLPAGTLRGEHVNIQANTRNPKATSKANAYLAMPISTTLADFLLAIRQTKGVRIFRDDLFYRALGALNKHELHPTLSLTEATEKYHSEFRFKGRPIRRRKLISTTLLVKGLEFDHAIILDATSLSKKELYVALTRGSRTLTIISTNAELTPRE